MKKRKSLREIIDVKIFRLKYRFYFFLARYRVISFKEANIRTISASIDMMKTMQELDVVEKQIDILKEVGVL